VSRAPTVCNTPGCPEDATRNGKCDGCRREKAAARPRNPDYSTDKWKRVRGRYKRLHPICETPGCGRESQEVHHIDADTSHNWDDNLEALCKSCHGKINLQPFKERDTIKAPRTVRVAPRGPGSDQPVVGGGLLDAMKRSGRL
jgi:5-methylcytosine-specific restriction endonuclease McrA